MKINSLHTYSWKPFLKIDAKLLPHRRPDAHVCINLIRCARPAQPVSCCLISLKAPSVQKSWPVLGPDELLQTADSVHHILPPPHPAPAPTRLRRGRTQTEREESAGQEIQTKFGSFMIYVLIFQAANGYRESQIIFLKEDLCDLILPDAGCLSRIPHSHSCQLGQDWGGWW